MMESVSMKKVNDYTSWGYIYFLIPFHSPINLDWIHIHIADPTTLFAPNSELDLYARARSSSIYLPEMKVRISLCISMYISLSIYPSINTHIYMLYYYTTKVSMFPDKLASGPMSIKSDQENYALTFSVKLDKENGSIIASKIFPTYIKNVRR